MSRKKIECPVNSIKLSEIVFNSLSYRQVAIELGINVDIVNYMRLVKRWISDSNLDVSHFTGMLWSKGNNRFTDNRILGKYTTIELGVGHPIETKNLRPILLNALGIPNICSICGIDEWMSKPLSLQIDHIDGDYSNSSPTNLRFLCPNCHSQTETYCRRGRANKIIVSDELLIEALQKNNSIRKALIEVGLTPRGNNYHRAYELCVKYGIIL